MQLINIFYLSYLPNYLYINAITTSNLTHNVTLAHPWQRGKITKQNTLLRNSLKLLPFWLRNGKCVQVCSGNRTEQRDWV